MGAWIETRKFVYSYSNVYVAPRVGAWIETIISALLSSVVEVAPRVGAWIETLWPCKPTSCGPSHPVWVRGLKPASHKPNMFDMRVAPRVGAWIETMMKSIKLVRKSVAPRVGAWIETRLLLLFRLLVSVAPRVGAWIETKQNREAYYFAKSHPVWVRGLKPTGLEYASA